MTVKADLGLGIQRRAQLTDALGRLMVVAEAYLELQADENMRQLSEEIASTENRVSFARQAYNDAVMIYNTKLSVFPDMFVAQTFSFAAAPLFEAALRAAKEAVDPQGLLNPGILIG